MVKTYKPSSVSIKSEEKRFDIENEDDIHNVPLPADWSLEKAEVFGSGVKVELARQDGGFVEVSPFPYPNQHIHIVNISGRKWKEEGWVSAVQKAFELVRQHTTDEPYKVQGPHTISTQYSSDLNTDMHPMSMDEFEHDTIDIECTGCGEQGMYLVGQTMEAGVDEHIRYEYECMCPTCGIEMTIEENHVTR